MGHMHGYTHRMGEGIINMGPDPIYCGGLYYKTIMQRARKFSPRPCPLYPILIPRLWLIYYVFQGNYMHRGESLILYVYILVHKMIL